MPVLEEFAESTDGFNFFVWNSGGGFPEGAGEELEGMEEAIFVCDGWMRKVVRVEFNSVGDKEGFRGGDDNLEAAVLFQGGDNIEAVAGAEGPGSAGGGLVVYEYAKSDGAEGGGLGVEGSIEVFPCGCEGGDGGLEEEVE